MAVRGAGPRIAAMLGIHAALLAVILVRALDGGGWVAFSMIFYGILPLSLLLHYVATTVFLRSAGYRTEAFAGVILTSAGLAIGALLVPDYSDSGPGWTLLGWIQDPSRGWGLAGVGLWIFSLALDAAFLSLAVAIRLLSRKDEPSGPPQA